MLKSPPRLLIIILIIVNSSLMNTVAGCALFRDRESSAPTTIQLAATPTLGIAQTPPPLEPYNVLEQQVMAVYDQTATAVVNITNSSYTYDYFMQPVPQEGTGSGFVYDRRGHIVTNYHVVENAQKLVVAFADGGNYTATVTGVDPTNDLAVIQITADQLPAPLPLGDSTALRVGQFVIAIGNPFGLEGTLTVGVISSLGRVIQSPDGRFIGEAIQTDAAINPGNSGGPLLDLSGRVIGVNSQIVSASGASAGIGFAVSVATVQRVVPQLIAQGRYPHPWLGVQLIDLTPERTVAFREAGMTIPVEQGLLLVEVVDDSPAAKAGLQGGNQVRQIGNVQIPLGGDIITAINDTPVTDMQQLMVYLETKTQVGNTIAVKVQRSGQEQIIPVTLAERPQ